MACLPGRRPERRLSSRVAVLVAALCLAGPGSLRAQQKAAASSSSTGIVVEGSVRLTRIRGQTVRMAGATALITLGDRFAFGLGQWTMVSDVSVVRPDSLDFAMMYGGAVGRLRLGGTGRLRASLRVLVGAGNGKLSLPLVGTEIQADNFGVLEPEVAASLDLGHRLSVSGGLGYREVFGVQDLPGVTGGDLRGWTTRLSLGLRAF